MEAKNTSISLFQPPLLAQRRVNAIAHEATRPKRDRGSSMNDICKNSCLINVLGTNSRCRHHVWKPFMRMKSDMERAPTYH